VDALKTYTQTIKISAYIERHLESLARIVEGMDSRTQVFQSLVAYIKSVFPGEDADAMAKKLVTEQCRAAYIKMMYAKRPPSFNGRD
jgi:hypothetical protein